MSSEERKAAGGSAIGLGARAAAIASRVSRVGAFNALAPRDPADRLGEGLAYGPDPMQALDVFAPVEGGDAPLARPMVLFFHGGGWNSGRRQDYGFVGRALASMGFLTLVAGYRLVPQVRYPDFVDDAALAAAWAVRQGPDYGGDPKRIALVGHSAGAYIALKLGLDVRHLEGAGVDPGVIRAIVGLSGPYHFLPLKSATTQAAFGQAPDLEATQPVHYARADAPPTLLIHGGADTVVSAGQTVRMGRALTGAGASPDVRILPGLSHADPILALSRPFRRKAPILDDITGFLKSHAT
jgi:acetyl esterase/lipase